MFSDLTESLEDYLLECYLLEQERGVARLKDIAKRRKVKPPSVVSAIRELVQRGLAAQERYGYVVLTEEGLREAERIYARHKAIFRFLHDVLGVPQGIAEMDAHRMEHHLHEETIARLVKFTESYRGFSHTEGKEESEVKTVKDLKVGQSAKIVEVREGAGGLKKRLIEIGAVPGTIIKMEKVAPLGDPIEVSLLGYHLSLRREEAEKIVVEEI